jgi:hypothetical protein
VLGSIAVTIPIAARSPAFLIFLSSPANQVPIAAQPSRLPAAILNLDASRDLNSAGTASPDRPRNAKKTSPRAQKYP